jgi:carboxypeptidase C (cathepsin A)
MYKSPKNELSVWAHSYGGHWGPGVAAFIQKQNENIATRLLCDAITINLDTVGVINGGIDFSITAASYPEMAYNNTYGFQAISQADYESAKTNLTTVCQPLINTCQELGAVYDPDNYGNNATVNSACSSAYRYCAAYVENVYLNSGV